MIPPLPFQRGLSAQSGSPSDPAIDIPTRSRNNNPFLNRFLVMPPADIPLPTLEEEVSISARKRDKLPATIGTVTPTNGATSHSNSKMPGEWS